MENIIVILILLGIVGGIIGYLIRAKKRGNKCIGCPHGSTCEKARNGGCGGNK